MLVPSTVEDKKYPNGATEIVKLGGVGANKSVMQLSIKVTDQNDEEVLSPTGTVSVGFAYNGQERYIQADQTIDLSEDYVATAQVAFVSSVQISVTGLPANTFWSPKIVVEG